MSFWSSDDYNSLAAMARRLSANPADILLVMKLESGLSPLARNPLSGAKGLIQFTGAALPSIGLTSLGDIPDTVKGQLPLVEKYFKNMQGSFGAVYSDAGDVYQAVFAPGTFSLGRSTDTVYYRGPGAAYEQNKGFDREGKGYITKGDTMRGLSSHLTSSEYRTALSELQSVTGQAFSPTLPNVVAGYNPPPIKRKTVAAGASGSAVQALLIGAAFATVYYRKYLRF